MLLPALIITGCAKSKPYLRSETYAHRDVRDEVKEDVSYPADVYDPIEGWNRGVYRFNYYFDKYLFLPVANTYGFIMPDIAELGVHNALKNLGEVNNFINSVLQLKGKAAMRAGGRFAVNSVVGVLGLYDAATPMGLDRWNEDFGQTLGHYGVCNGPYLVLPIFGPSNLRDGFGLLSDSVINLYTDPFNIATDRDYVTPYGFVKGVDTRRFTAFRYYETGSPFEYGLIRLMYTEMRTLQIEK
jgi:phospholipid-binding lipoprotein MlaA